MGGTALNGIAIRSSHSSLGLAGTSAGRTTPYPSREQPPGFEESFGFLKRSVDSENPGSHHATKLCTKKHLADRATCECFDGVRKLRELFIFFRQFSVSLGLQLDAKLLRSFSVFIGHSSGRFPLSDSIRILGRAAACEDDQTANNQGQGAEGGDVFLHNQLRLGGKPH